MGIMHNELIAILRAALPSMPDSLALRFINMFPYWEDCIGVEITQEVINKGYDRYQYKGQLYKAIQPHTPSENQTPDNSPELWEKIE